jgi:hypothetical protein
MIKTRGLPDLKVMINVPAFNEQWEELVKVVELLDLSPLHSIASDIFISRFRILLDAIEGFFRQEEELLNYYAVPSEIRLLHVSDHERIRRMLNDINMNSLRKKNQTAVEVYEGIRFEIDRHVECFSFDVSRYVPLRMH